MDKADYKELQGRYATKIMFPGRKYDFTEPKFSTYDALSTGKCTCVEEYKAYNDPQYPRYHNKTGNGIPINNYQLDYDKCRQVVKRAMNDKVERRQALLYVYFTDYLYIWDLDKTDWEKTAEWRKVNKKGVAYGEKEWELQAFLKFEDAIYHKEIPDGFWDKVDADIDKDYPGLKEQLFTKEESIWFTSTTL